MSGAQHTPGNWTVEERASYFGVFSTPAKGWATSKRLVAACAKPHADALANAHLIEAAPDMLEALKKAQQFIRNGIDLGYIHMPDLDTPDTAHDTPPMIAAALAKAEGRS